ncbi:hypothetical protein ACR6C2_22585 [Streptomyces sp. INA 01156]
MTVGSGVTDGSGGGGAGSGSDGLLGTGGSAGRRASSAPSVCPAARCRPAPERSPPRSATPRPRPTPRPALLTLALPVLARTAPALALGHRAALAVRASRPRRQPSTGCLTTRPACGMRRLGGPARPVLTDTHTTGGSGDGHDGGGQAGRYVQGAHEATSGCDAGSMCPTPATRKRTRQQRTSDRPVTYP